MLKKLFKKSKDPRYVAMKATSISVGETKDCSVISMALAVKITYQKSHEAFAKCGRQFRTGTWTNKVNGVLYELGIRHTRYNQFEIAEMARNVGLARLTFRNVSAVLKQDRNYLVLSKNHSAAIMGKKVVDWSAGTNKEVVSLEEIHG